MHKTGTEDISVVSKCWEIALKTKKSLQSFIATLAHIFCVASQNESEWVWDSVDQCTEMVINLNPWLWQHSRKEEDSEGKNDEHLSNGELLSTSLTDLSHQPAQVKRLHPPLPTAMQHTKKPYVHEQ